MDQPNILNYFYGILKTKVKNCDTLFTSLDETRLRLLEMPHPASVTLKTGYILIGIYAANLYKNSVPNHDNILS